MSLVKSYEPNRNIHSFHGGKDCMKKFSADLRSLAMEIINLKKKKKGYH